MSATATQVTQLTAPNQTVEARNGVGYAYRRLGDPSSSAPPLVSFQHFRGNLDNWDPALVDALARTREVILFDNAGVGGSSGTVPAHGHRDGARRAQLHRGPGAARDRRARLLARRVRRAGAGADPPAARQPPRARRNRATGWRGHARLQRRDVRRREPRPTEGRGHPGAVLRAQRDQSSPRAGSSSSASSPARTIATPQPRSRCETPSWTRSPPGGFPTRAGWVASPGSRSRCSSPTATTTAWSRRRTRTCSTSAFRTPD